MSQPLQISADTAIKLSKQLGIPIEHLMHMPKHILLQKLGELAKAEAEANTAASSPSEDEASGDKPL
ncbi:YycC-like protein [Paenibacillus algorifonticola]|uniref:YycC-like protein n=1 Tax=Paenibacillus algorifonticola TaxID=684063 RepID=A0A1I2GI48_9BACL|nr:YycC family protein [Paenibacillus algorifonticola]SFF16908.1 YycC-like protein [Paenibacillus algorifonticola]